MLKFLVLRDLRLVYKQTILGPVHLFIRPLIMTLVFQLVFSEFGNISTDGIHPFLFYYANQTLWSFFAGVFGTSSSVFMGGKALMSKVYFPRVIPVLACVVTNAVTLGIQLLFFSLVYFYFVITEQTTVPPFSIIMIVFPVLQMALLGVGSGLVFATLTLRYRDLNSLSGVIIQGLMYLSPVIYPFAVVPEKYQFYAAFNPISAAMELFRFSLFGSGDTSLQLLVTGWIMSGVLIVAGLSTFNLTHRKFVDFV